MLLKLSTLSNPTQYESYSNLTQFQRNSRSIRFELGWPWVWNGVGLGCVKAPNSLVAIGLSPNLTSLSRSSILTSKPSMDLQRVIETWIGFVEYNYVTLCECSYVENKTDHWQPAPMIVLKDVEDLNRLKIAVWLSHRMNHQDMGERWVRRALLVEEMVKIFRELDIEYRMLPLNVNVRSLPPITSTRSPSNWTASTEWSK